MWWYLESLEQDPDKYGSVEGGPVERLCYIWGQPWRAVTVCGGDLSHDPVRKALLRHLACLHFF